MAEFWVESNVGGIWSVKIIVYLLLCVSAFAQLPNKALTPGKIRTSDASEICAKTFRTKPFRHTTSAMKKQVCASYGFKVGQCPKQGFLEIDHLTPLELGGQDDVLNLWPELAEYPDGPGFHVKDKLENFLHKEVCSGQMKLPDAQKCIMDDWISCAKRMGVVK
jgi:hypothetical protein